MRLRFKKLQRSDDQTNYKLHVNYTSTLGKRADMHAASVLPAYNTNMQALWTKLSFMMKPTTTNDV